MNKNYVDIYNKLLAKSLELGKIVNLLSEKNSKIFSELEKWLDETEEIMNKSRISNTLEIASLRAKVASISMNSKKTRKEKFIEISNVLYELKNIFMPVIKPIEDKVEESKIIIRQCLEFLDHAKKMPKIKDYKKDFTSFVNSVWVNIQQQPELKNAYVNLVSKISLNDVLMLIAEEIKIN